MREERERARKERRKDEEQCSGKAKEEQRSGAKINIEDHPKMAFKNYV